MALQKEVYFGDDDLYFKDASVKSSILPQNSKELSRNLVIQGNTTIEGGVYGNKITIEDGNVTLQGAVFANTEFHIESEIKNPVSCLKAVASTDTIAAFISFGRAYFWSDINAQTVRLKNCYVGGNVFAGEVYIENCIVLGGIFATKHLTISNCMVGTFHAPSVELAGIDYLLYPACFSTEPISYLPGTELYNISLAHLGALFKGEKEDPDTGRIKMDIENDHLKTVLVGDDDVNTIVNSYSVSGRVLAADMIDTEKLENHFLIGAGSLGTQILKTYSLTKKDGTKSEELSVENIAAFLFDILLGRIQIQNLSGEIRFEDIKKNFE